ncbi:hypothetical protein LTR17_021011 [Elasticomyces elasticus]|nr:hypothetical protein LTR17_021011 [Elasticomyces elasticus]
MAPQANAAARVRAPRNPIQDLPIQFRESKLAEFRHLGCSDPGAHLWGTPHRSDSRWLNDRRVRDFEDARIRRISYSVAMVKICPLEKNLDFYRHELERHEQEQDVLRILCSGRLPKELVLRVLGCKAIGTLPDLLIRHKETLPAAAWLLLGVEAPEPLLHLMECVILESVPIVLTPATFPDFATPLLPKIRTLVEVVDILRENQFPVDHWDLIPRLPSLAAQLSHVALWRMEVRVAGQGLWQHFALDVVCAEELATGKKITYGMVVEEMVAAVQAARPGKRQSLRMNFNGPTEMRSRLEEVVIDERSAAELVTVACGNAYVGGAASSGS